VRARARVRVRVRVRVEEYRAGASMVCLSYISIYYVCVRLCVRKFVFVCVGVGVQSFAELLFPWCM